MAIDDPKTRYRPEPKEEGMAGVLAMMVEMQQETARLLLEMKQSGGSSNANAIELLIQQQERLLTKTRPENQEHPGISAYSHPEGDVARPKADLKCKMFWVGFEETKETLTPLEVDLLNRLEPGLFYVMKTDGTKIKFEVSAKRNDRDELEQLDIKFPCKGDNRHNHGSKVSYLQQALGESIPDATELMAELLRLKAELAATRVGVAVP